MMIQGALRRGEDGNERKKHHIKRVDEQLNNQYQLTFFPRFNQHVSFWRSVGNI